MAYNEYRIETTMDKEKYEKSWNTAIGLQKVDNLQPSKYLLQLKEENINGNLSNEEIEKLLYKKYENETEEERKERKKECDIVSNRMTELLITGNFPFVPTTLKFIHGYLFKDIYDFAGRYRTYNITKSEPILGGESVKYANYYMIEETLAYDFAEESKKKYAEMEEKKISESLARFTSGIWQVHPFGEGNTRTTALFIENYLRERGFSVDNSLFKEKAQYFRNALVRSNYADYANGIDMESKFLEDFFENLLFRGRNKLENRKTIIEKLVKGKKESKKR